MRDTVAAQASLSEGLIDCVEEFYEKKKGKPSDLLFVSFPACPLVCLNLFCLIFPFLNPSASVWVLSSDWFGIRVFFGEVEILLLLAACVFFGLVFSFMRLLGLLKTVFLSFFFKFECVRVCECVWSPFFSLSLLLSLCGPRWNSWHPFKIGGPLRPV